MKVSKNMDIKLYDIKIGSLVNFTLPNNEVRRCMVYGINVTATDIEYKAIDRENFTIHKFKAAMVYEVLNAVYPRPREILMCAIKVDSLKTKMNEVVPVKSYDKTGFTDDGMYLKMKEKGNKTDD